MSLPPELRVLCAQLTTTSPVDLPRLTPTLLRYIFQCRAPLSSPTVNTAKPDSNTASVQVHKLKTQLSSLLNGKSPEGRFTAVVLIKGVVEAGGWEILKGSEPWVRGLLSILGRPDSIATKEMCIVTLTKIYSMTHPYQTLLREITTPTLPTFITSSLNLLSSKSSQASSQTAEIICRSFITLIPRHTTLYRPFATQIRLAIRQYLAPTISDQLHVPSSLQTSAQRLTIMLHQTVAKGGGGEEWGKSFRELLKGVHVTADIVFRAVIEDWESTAGYVPETADVNQITSGGGRTPDDLSSWSSINAGAERLIGLLSFLSTYFAVETSTPVAIPLGAVADLIVRVLSVSIPSAESSKTREGPRLNPAVDRDEKDVLWSHMPHIYCATLVLIESMADRLGAIFVPLAQGLLNQVVWVFNHGKHNLDFRQTAYRIIAKLLKLSGQSLGKLQVSKFGSIIRVCCKDLQGSESMSSILNTETKITNGPGQIADTFLRQPNDLIDATLFTDPAVTETAQNLLPLIISCIPQQHLDIALRSLVERTAILTHNKEAMLECVLKPFVGKNGAPLASIVPHLTQAYGYDSTVEILLRPRMPLVPASTTRYVSEANEEVSEDEDMENPMATRPVEEGQVQEAPQEETSNSSSIFRTESTSASATSAIQPHIPAAVPSIAPEAQSTYANRLAPVVASSVFAPVSAQPVSTLPQDTEMAEGLDESSDAESVHLTMQLDSESDSDEEQ